MKACVYKKSSTLSIMKDIYKLHQHYQ